MREQALAMHASTTSEVADEQAVRPEFAEAIAAAWLRDYARFFQSELDRDRGDHVSVLTLTVCREPLFASSRMTVMPQARESAAARVAGSWWLVSICSPDGSVRISLAISAHTSLTLDQNGQIVFSRRSYGADIFPLGVPRTWKGPVAVSAESAMTIAKQMLGVGVKEAPSLLAPYPRAGLPQGAIWRLRAVRPVAIYSEGDRRVETDVFFVVPSSASYGTQSFRSVELMVANESADTVDHCARIDRTASAGLRVTCTTRVDVPLDFRRVLKLEIP
jgi:hypothetical protein